MLIARVVGNVTATRKAERLDGLRFLLLQPHAAPPEKTGAERENTLLAAVDLLGAGPGDDVLVAVGRAARLAVGGEDVPIDAAVVGIVDRL
jgi:ethanolamine utilization protein EutN